MNLNDIKADDPGGSVEEALIALKVLQVTGALESNPVSIRMVAAMYGLEVAESIRQKIEAAFPAWVHDLFVSDGLDICESNTQTKIVNPPFSDDEVTKLLSFTTQTQLKYPRIRYGDIEKARAL